MFYGKSSLTIRIIVSHKRGKSIYNARNLFMYVSMIFIYSFVALKYRQFALLAPSSYLKLQLSRVSAPWNFISPMISPESLPESYLHFLELYILQRNLYVS